MNTNIQIFTSEIFGEIRTCQVNNQIMFVGKGCSNSTGIQLNVFHQQLRGERL